MTPPKATSAVDGNIKKPSRFHSLLRDCPAKKQQWWRGEKLDALAGFDTNLPSVGQGFLHPALAFAMFDFRLMLVLCKGISPC